MARSVATHPHSASDVYLNLSEELSGLEFNDEFDSLLSTIQHVLIERFPSLRHVSRWQGNENNVILESFRAEVSVSEYCGLVSVCLAPRDPDHPLDQHWSNKAVPGFIKALHEAFLTCALRSIGRASNGEQFFAPINRVGGLVTSKDGTLW